MDDILVVDDALDILDMLQAALTRHGYTTRPAANGEEALHRLAERLPRLILLDMKMPVMDGWEFVKRFRATYDHACPIVVMSAAEDIRLRMREVGADDCIAKPFDLRQLATIVAKYMQ